MVMESGFVAVAPTLSVTRTVKLEPVPVGVPLISPLLEFNDKPDGSAPDAMDQLSGAVPPKAARVVEYGEPAVAPGNALVVTVGVGAIVIDNN